MLEADPGGVIAFRSGFVPSLPWGLIDTGVHGSHPHRRNRLTVLEEVSQRKAIALTARIHALSQMSTPGIERSFRFCRLREAFGAIDYVKRTSSHSSSSILILIG